MQRHDCIEALKQLKLAAMAEAWDDIVTDGIRRKRGTMDILARLIQTEQTQRHIRSIEYRLKQARFAQPRSLAEFKFDQTPLNQEAKEEPYCFI